ncbi:hypothetical protein V5799_015239 [Amblyomma americanum]|uniref:Uncharacterized protein n=1 Tax=Amblyomma americanum TaxID=6943 RepID=A0AAQ4E0Q6_AMBAM
MKTLHEQLGSLFSIQMSLVQVACRLRESHQSLLLTIPLQLWRFPEPRRDHWPAVTQEIGVYARSIPM